MSDNLMAELGAIADRKGPDFRGAVLAHLKARLKDAKELARKRFERGRLDGLETARLLAAIHDGIIIGLCKFTQEYVIAPEIYDEVKTISVCAVGGYGRGEMAPESDVDLLILTPKKTSPEAAGALTEYILYMLWDLG